MGLDGPPHTLFGLNSSTPAQPITDINVILQDELLWAAAWLYEATNNQYYLNYLGENGDSMGGTGWSMTEFGWDVKYAGVQTLVAKVCPFFFFE